MSAHAETGYAKPPIARPIRQCKRCDAEGVELVLLHDPDSPSPNRVLCGACQGAANRRILDNLRPMKRDDR